MVTVALHGNVMSLLGQSANDELRGLRIVLDQQYSHRRCLGLRHLQFCKFPPAQRVVASPHRMGCGQERTMEIGRKLMLCILLSAALTVGCASRKEIETRPHLPMSFTEGT